MVSLIIIVLCQGALGIIGYEAIHTFEKWMAIVLGVMFVVLTIAILGQASTGIARSDGFTGLDQLGAFVLYASIAASFVVAWGLYASDYTPLSARRRHRSRVFWWTVLGLTLSAGLARSPRSAGGRQAATGGAVDTINDILSGASWPRWP